MNPRTIAITQVLAILLAATLGTVLAKIVLRDVPPFTFVWLQIAFGGSLLSLYTFGVRRERIPRGLSRRVWAYIAGIGICSFTIVRLAGMFSLERLPATTYAYLLNFVFIVTMGMSILFLKERPTFLQIVGAILAVVGLRVFFSEIPAPSAFIGVAYVAIAVVALACYNTLARQLGLVAPRELSNNIISTLALWIGGVPVVVAGLLTDSPPPTMSLSHWGIIGFNGLVNIAIVLTVFNHVLRTLRSYEASILATSGVIYTAILSIPILGEHLDLREVIGITMMVCGLALAQIRGSLTSR